MKEKKVYVKRMAKETGYSDSTIYNWITGKSAPHLYPARDIAQYLGVTDKDI